MSFGFSRAGFQILLAVDKSKSAVETYRKNFRHPVMDLDLSTMPPLPSATVIVGGPPCQGFSSAGARRNGDPRNSLVGLFARLVVRQLPRAFVFENVEGFLTGDGGAHVVDLIRPLIAAGYRIHLRKINAANFGVPQHRKRVVAIGGLGWDPTFPEPTHTAFGAPGTSTHTKHLPPTPSVAEAFQGLPRASLLEEGFPQGHVYSELSENALSRASRLLPGMTMRDLPVVLQHDSYKRRANRRVCDGTLSERRGGAPAGIRRLAPNEPSKAITSGARTEFLHPFEHRNITIRECARLQTFPDNFEFSGSTNEQSLLVGNAVPPILSMQIARTLLSDLESNAKFYEEGSLLSYVPTMSLGMSPALKKTTSLVTSTTKVEGSQEVFPFVTL